MLTGAPDQQRVAVAGGAGGRYVPEPAGCRRTYYSGYVRTRWSTTVEERSVRHQRNKMMFNAGSKLINARPRRMQSSTLTSGAMLHLRRGCYVVYVITWLFMIGEGGEKGLTHLKITKGAEKFKERLRKRLRSFKWM